MAIDVSPSASPGAQQLAHSHQPLIASSHPAKNEKAAKGDSFSPQNYWPDDAPSLPTPPRRTVKRKQQVRSSPLSSPAPPAKKPLHKQLLEIERQERTPQRQRRKKGVLSEATQLYAGRTRESREATIDALLEGDKVEDNDESEEEKTMSVHNKAKMKRMVGRPKSSKIKRPRTLEDELGSAAEGQHVRPSIQRSSGIAPASQISRIATASANAPSRAEKERIVVQTLYDLPRHLIIDLFLPWNPDRSTPERPEQRQLQRGAKGHEDIVALSTRFMLETEYKQRILGIDFSALTEDNINELLVTIPAPSLMAVFSINTAPHQLLKPSRAVINSLRARPWYQTAFISLTNVATDYARFYYPAREDRIIWDAKKEKAWTKGEDEHKERPAKSARISGTTFLTTLYPDDPGYDEQVAGEDEVSAEEASDGDEMDVDDRLVTNGFG